jgi:hypothetical protein
LRAVVLTSAGLIVALVLFVWIVFARGGGRVLAQRVFARIPGADVIRRGVSTLQSYGSDRRPLWQALGASLFAQGMGVTCFVLLTRATVSPSLEWGLFVIVPIGLVVNTVPLTPGGLGVGEAAFAVLFGMIGLQGGPEVLIAWRLLSIVVGLAGLYFYLRGRKQFVSTRERARGADDPPPSSSGATPPQRHAVAGSTLAPGGLDA